jgi:hypothetical protein
MKRIILGCCAALALVAIAPAGASATVSPGVQTVTEGAQCTANFIFRDGGGTYVGQAAHCSGTGAATDTDGCTSESLPIGTPVSVGGGGTGTLVYNSWITMQQNGESDPDVCAYNDFALVRLNASDAASVNPSVPGFGGPTGVAEPPTGAGSAVFTYGNSSLRLGVTKLSPKQGVVVQQQGNGWSRDVYTVTPGIPGDSGSGFMDSNGEAIGVLSTVQLAPIPASNGVGNLAKELQYARAHGFGGLDIVRGGPFNGSLVSALLGA